MNDPYVGQIEIFPYNFAPHGYEFCQGQLLPISMNTALFTLIQCNFGGDCKSTFALPNFTSLNPEGSNYCIAMQGTMPQGQASPSFIGEIAIFGYNSVPSGWMLCDGRSLSSTDYPALFQVIGTTFGGDGQNFFNLPDFRNLPLSKSGGFYAILATGDSLEFPAGALDVEPLHR